MEDTFKIIPFKKVSSLELLKECELKNENDYNKNLINDISNIVGTNNQNENVTSNILSQVIKKKF